MLGIARLITIFICIQLVRLKKEKRIRPCSRRERFITSTTENERDGPGANYRPTRSLTSAQRRSTPEKWPKGISLAQCKQQIIYLFFSYTRRARAGPINCILCMRCFVVLDFHGAVNKNKNWPLIRQSELDDVCVESITQGIVLCAPWSLLCIRRELAGQARRSFISRRLTFFSLEPQRISTMDRE